MPPTSDIVTEIAPGIKLLNARPPISGFSNFIGTYLIDGVKKALIDIGPRAAVPGVIAALQEVGFKPEQIDLIILTHIHIDHGGGTGLALKSMTNARVLLHPRGKNHMVDPAVLWKASLETLGETARKYGEIDPVAAESIILAEDNMVLDMGEGLILDVHMTPGHAAHHLSIFERRSRVLFAGDSAGVYSSGVLRLTTPPPFRLEDYLASVDRMIALKPEILCYAHFGCRLAAIDRLNDAKTKAQLWYDVAQAGAKAGKTAEQVTSDIMEKDAELRYLSGVGKDEYSRDFSLILSSVHGLMNAR